MLKVWRGDNIALEIPLQAAEAVESGPLHRRAMDGLAELFGGCSAPVCKSYNGDLIGQRQLDARQIHYL